MSTTDEAGSTMTDQPTLVFLDTETTGLDPKRHRIWDLAYIVREPGEPDREVQHFMPELDLPTADPYALRVGQFYDRYPYPHSPLSDPWSSPELAEWPESAEEISRDLHGATIVGVNPWFDCAFLTEALNREYLRPTWDYHLVDITTYAAGMAGIQPPWTFDQLLPHYALTPHPSGRHTALGDARAVRDLYDAVTQPLGKNKRAGERT